MREIGWKAPVCEGVFGVGICSWCSVHHNSPHSSVILTAAVQFHHSTHMHLYTLCWKQLADKHIKIISLKKKKDSFLERCELLKVKKWWNNQEQFKGQWINRIVEEAEKNNIKDAESGWWREGMRQEERGNKGGERQTTGGVWCSPWETCS